MLNSISIRMGHSGTFSIKFIGRPICFVQCCQVVLFSGAICVCEQYAIAIEYVHSKCLMFCAVHVFVKLDHRFIVFLKCCVCLC